MIAEYTSISSQAVAIGSNVAFTEKAVSPNGCGIMHRTGSGIITLRGRGRYIVNFSANVSGATAGTQLLLALALNGETLGSATMSAVSAVANDLNNVSTSVVIDVPCGCCVTIAVENVGTIETTVANANIIIEKEETV